MDFSSRSTATELMDTETCAFEDFQGCLRDLATVNHLTLAYRPTLEWLDRLIKNSRIDGPLRIVDVGSGYGDMLRRIDRWAAGRAIKVELTGVDMNPWSARAAGEATAPDRIRWVTSNAFTFMPEGGIDIIICSLFTHHLSDADNVELLKWMEKTARLGWYINDLHRHKLPYYFFRTLVRFSNWHRFVKHDGPVSIARSFVKQDWQKLLVAAEVRATIKWFFPFRLCVSHMKSDAAN